ncbi:hypothetical protein TYRP_014153 [Tyrophagus putrescentiae]|nr:hypothetical protein TYRP_014153 [Tyrophagus putrescentiae]
MGRQSVVSQLMTPVEDQATGGHRTGEDQCRRIATTTSILGLDFLWTASSGHFVAISGSGFLLSS